MMCRNLIMIIHRYILLFYICDNNYIYVCVCVIVCVSVTITLRKYVYIGLKLKTCLHSLVWNQWSQQDLNVKELDLEQKKMKKARHSLCKSSSTGKKKKRKSVKEIWKNYSYRLERKPVVISKRLQKPTHRSHSRGHWFHNRIQCATKNTRADSSSSGNPPTSSPVAPC